MKRALRCGVAVLAGLALLVWLHAPLLAGAARAWIVNEPAAKADAIVVLGGGLENRPFEAARLYHAGVAPKVLFMATKPSPTTKLGITPTEEELTRKVLLQQGVAEGDLVVIGHGVASTFDESAAVREWAQAHHAKRIVIPTDIFHTRRVRWLFRKQLRASGVQVLVEAAPTLGYSADDWWQHEEGLIAFQNEIIKFGYYWFKY